MDLKPLFLLTAVLFSCTNLPAQSTILKAFSGFQQSSSIQLSFTIAGGNTCLGIDIQRSVDSIQFTTIGSIAGICGSNDKDENYTYKDEAPMVNQPNYYRLVLGQLGNSDFISVPYLDYSEGLVIFPNPVTESTLVYFANEKNESSTVKIFDAGGILQFSAVTNLSFISLGSNNLAAGIYLAVLEQEGHIRYGKKIIVQ